MSDLNSTIQHISADLETALAHAGNHKDLDDIRLAFLGKKGTITALMGQLKEMSLDEKKVYGPQLQALRNNAEASLEATKQALTQAEIAKAEQKLHNFDITSYLPNKKIGHLHPYTHFIQEIQDIFLSMGYEIWDGPEFETEFHNFSALNIPQDHPARDMYDTFWTNSPGMLLRTHTSPVQVRAMQKALQNKSLPIAGIAPGRVYRHEAVDASHDFMFMQCEGLLIDKNVTIAQLFATAQTFLKALFKKDHLDIRIRPGFFPFVEPGFEIDMRCVFCKNGCSVCKKSTWIEVFPGGLVHPNELKAIGINPDEYSGFAFGFGLTRLAMLKYGIDDIRLFCNGKVKFLEQF